MKAAIITLVLVSVVLGAAGCSSTPVSEGSATPGLSTASGGRTSTTTTTVRAAIEEDFLESAETTAPPDVKIGELGERRNPIPVGQEAQVGVWKVRVVGATLNATQAVLDENMFNEAPQQGRQYVLVSLEATYAGTESSTFWLDMMYKFVGGKGNSFDTAAVVAPHSMLEQGEAFAGASVAGNLVFEVESDQISGGTLLLEEAFSFEQTRLFFAVR